MLLLLLFCLHAYSLVAEARPLRPERAPWKCLFDARSILCVLYKLYVDSPVGAGALEVPAPCMINRSREMIQTGTTMEDQQPLRDISWLGCYPYCYYYYYCYYYCC